MTPKITVTGNDNVEHPVKDIHCAKDGTVESIICSDGASFDGYCLAPAGLLKMKIYPS